MELHKLITIPDYYSSKISILRNMFLAGKLSKEDCFNLLSYIEFFEKEYLVGTYDPLWWQDKYNKATYFR